MSILNLNGPAGRSPRGKRAVKVWMGIGLVIAVLGVGSTLASTITINGNTNQEFGQGVQRTVYCGGNKTITVTPVSSYLNVPEPMPSESASESSRSESESESPSPSASDLAGTFYLSGIKVTDVPRECSGVDFVFSVYDQAGTPTPIKISSRGGVDIFTPTVYWYDQPRINVAGADYFGLLSSDRTTFRPDTIDQMSLTVFDRYEENGAFTITFNGAGTYPSINDVGRIVVETQNDAIFKTLETPAFPPLVRPNS